MLQTEHKGIMKQNHSLQLRFRNKIIEGSLVELLVKLCVLTSST